MESVGGAKQVAMWNRWAGLKKSSDVESVGGAKKSSDVESVGGAKKKAVMWNRWAGLNRQRCGIGGRG